MVTAGSLDGLMVSTLARNARDVGSIPALGTIFPIFITPMTYIPYVISDVARTFNPNQSLKRGKANCVN